MDASRTNGIVTPALGLQLALALILQGCGNETYTPSDQDTTSDAPSDSTLDSLEDPAGDGDTDGTEDPVYPSFVGEWEYTRYDMETGDPIYRQEMVYTETTMEMNFYNYVGPDTEVYGFGLRTLIAVTGHTIMLTLDEASTDGDMWFSESSDPTAWDAFVSGNMGGIETWSSIYAVSTTGNHLFFWSDDMGEESLGMATRTGGTAITAIGYPDTLGTWQTTISEPTTSTPTTMITVVVDETSQQTDIYNYPPDWEYTAGMRADYTTDGDEMIQTFTEFSHDGVSWFSEGSDPVAWNDFLTGMLDGHDTATAFWAVSPTGERMFVAGGDWSGGIISTLMYIPD